MSAIEVKNLVKKFHGQTVLHGIDLEVKPGEVVAIIGPSGSGKTTLLRSINLLEQPEAGTITVGDITIDTARSLSQQKSLIRQLRQHVGFVFQNFNLFPHRTVLENIIEGPVIVKIQPKPHIQTDSCRVCPLCHATHLTKSGKPLPCPFLTPGSRSLPLCTSSDLQQVLLFFLSFRTSSTLQGPDQFQHHLLRNPLQLDFEFILL